MTQTRSRIVLFDIDGTLLKSDGVGRKATAAAMLEVFGTASSIDLHHFSGKTDYFTLTELLAEHGFDHDAVAARLGNFAAAMGRYTQHFAQEANIHPLPGALEAVHRLRADERSLVGLVTGNTPPSAAAKLRAAGFDPDWFAVGAFGTESVDRNDLPAYALQRAQQYCGHPFMPEQAYVIGDTVMDIACARAVGAVAIAVRNGFGDVEQLEQAEPDYLLDDLTQLFEVL